MKRFFSTFLYIGLALIITLSGCKNSIYSKHKVKTTEIFQTKKFLDFPDSMVYMYNKSELEFSEEKKSFLYEKFSELMKTLFDTSTLKTPFNLEYIDEWRDNNISVEFRYNQRHEFTGSLQNYPGAKEVFTWGNLKFDAFLLIYYSDSLIAIPYLEDTYVGINDLFLVLNFPEAPLSTFIEALNEATK